MIGTEIIALIAVGTLLVYLFVSPRLAEGVLYRKSLFSPRKYPNGDYETEKINGICRQDVEFSSFNGNKLHGWFFSNKDSRKTILLSHGNAGNMGDLNRLLELLLKSGASVFVYDYQGYGKSEGAPSIRALVEDGLAAYDWLVSEQKTDWRNIIVYGESMGGAVSAQIALARPIDSMILQSAFSSLRQIGMETIPILAIYPKQLFPQPYFDNKAVLGQFDRPVLILHGALDKEVKYSHAETLYDKAFRQKNLVCLPNTAHAEVSELDSCRFIDAVKVHLMYGAELVAIH